MKKIQEVFDLSGKVAIVTGGAVGIGKGAALRLAEAGASVIIADINIKGASETANEIKAAGYKAKEIHCDVRKVEDAKKTVQAAVDIFGDLHILVNNAGIYPITTAFEMVEDTWDDIITTNLKGTMFFAKAAAQMMVSKGHGGKIVNIASVDAIYPMGNVVAYDASKGGVVMLTKSLAKELCSRGINVNAIAPGVIRTPGTEDNLAKMSKEQIEGMTKFFASKILVGHQGEPDDIAMAVLFLASKGADYIIGSTLVVDGGYLLA